MRKSGKLFWFTLVACSPWLMVAYVVHERASRHQPSLSIPIASDLVLPSHITPEERTLTLLALREHY